VSVVPFLALLCGPALERLLPGMNDQGEALEKPAPMLRPYHGAREAIKRVSIWFLIGISVGVQWLGMLIPFRFVQGHLITLAYPHFLPETFNRPAWSPLVLQWKFITPENVHFAWWQGGAIDPWALALPLAGVAAGATLLLLTARRGERLLLRRAGAIYGAGMLAIILVMLLRLQLPLSGVVNVALTNEIERSERAGDAIMHLAHVETQKFANVYHGRLPAYGLEEQATIYPGEEMRVGIFMERHDRFWVVSEGRDSEWEQELTAHGGTLVSERWFGEGDTARRLALYEMGE